MSPKPWPEKKHIEFAVYDLATMSLGLDLRPYAAYHYNRAEAALERLRIAVEALREAEQALDMVGAHVPQERAARALQAIGEIPE